MKKRLKFAKTYKKYNYDDWAKILFTDESKFNLHVSDNGSMLWCREKENTNKQSLSFLRLSNTNWGKRFHWIFWFVFAMWCWAAVAQMILALRGQQLSQEQIVKLTLGDVAGKGVSSAELAQRLSRIGITAEDEKTVKKFGSEFTHYTAEQGARTEVGFDPLAASGGTDIIDSRQLALDLYQRRIFILAYGTGAARAHAVLLFGADISVEPFDFPELDEAQIQTPRHKVTIQKYHVLNPWPGKGHQVLSPEELQELVKWRVSLARQVM